VAQISIARQNAALDSSSQSHEVAVVQKRLVHTVRARIQQVGLLVALHKCLCMRSLICLQLSHSLSLSRRAFKIFIIVSTASAAAATSVLLIALAPGRPLKLTLDLIIFILSSMFRSQQQHLQIKTAPQLFPSVYSCFYLPYRISCDIEAPSQLCVPSSFYDSFPLNSNSNSCRLCQLLWLVSHAFRFMGWYHPTDCLTVLF
jgi:hypothetical protein